MIFLTVDFVILQLPMVLNTFILWNSGVLVVPVTKVYLYNRGIVAMHGEPFL